MRICARTRIATVRCICQRRVAGADLSNRDMPHERRLAFSLAKNTVSIAAVGVIATFAIVCGSTSVAQETPALVQECGEPEYLLEGFRDARSQLKSGVYSAKGNLVRHAVQYGTIEGEFKAFSAFDYERGITRFDRNEPRLFVDPDSGQSYVREVGMRVARTEKETLVWDASAKKWGCRCSARKIETRAFSC